MDFILFGLFALMGGCLLIGLSRKEKKWIGGIGGLMALVFIVVSQIIKLQTGFYGEWSQEVSETVGQWVVPCFLVLGIYLLGMINYRWIKAALNKELWVKWLLLGLDILFSLVYIWFGGFVLFIVAFTYFPFAP
ncbi:hypothetical protein NC661_03745 [Aquibacillus koreensis]|uniref:Uncharacterized protein n=1 Tax=Aquibacillus koreensis TaxID=279446 RepID=A0A9X3WLB9_9BACI|nr:hypothetical protein [Aquibacillus koreensis]MCT2536437.1 hypothetical protein [Aquibacillus koreensis]MDC3419474.1 hypothetical protein [Aquibacillus koreensis]